MADFTITLQYNTERSKLIVPEYGRNIQKMVQKIATIPDRKYRTKKARQLIGAMAKMTPKSKETPDLYHKLWDLLHIMSGFSLDVDSPYPKPTPESIVKKPGRLAYPQKEPKYRYYGNNVMRMIEVCNRLQESEAKNSFKLAIADHMKRCFINWNKENVQDDLIFEHLKELSQGKIDLTDSNKDLSSADTWRRKNQRKNQNQNNNNKRKHFNNNNHSFQKKKRF